MGMEQELQKEVLFPSSVQMKDADNYNDWTFKLFRRYLVGNVLEVGCGVGSFTRRMIESCGSIKLLGVDISREAVEYCRGRFNHLNLELKCIDVLHVQGAFDAIICMNVLEHIEDDKGALEHLLELLSPGGTLFLLVPAHQFLFSRFDVENGHFRRYNKKSMRELISSVSDSGEYRMEQFYFNSVGALGYWLTYKVLRKNPDPNGMAEIDLFDRWLVPVVQRIEGKHMPFGISLVAILSKKPSEVL